MSIPAAAPPSSVASAAGAARGLTYHVRLGTPWAVVARHVALDCGVMAAVEFGTPNERGGAWFAALCAGFYAAQLLYLALYVRTVKRVQLRCANINRAAAGALGDAVRERAGRLLAAKGLTASVVSLCTRAGTSRRRPPSTRYTSC